MAATDRPTPPAPAPLTGTTATAACRELVSELADRWELPSIYLVIDGRLRCMAASGYFRLLEGFTPESGLIGRAMRTGRTVVVDDVEADTDFVPSVPGVVAQVAAPVSVGGRRVGAVSVEARSALTPEGVTEAEAAARRLGETIEALGGVPVAPMGQRLARLAVDLGAEGEVERLRRMVVEGVAGIAGRSSAALVAVSPGDRWEVVCSTGPLAQAISEWKDTELATLAQWLSVGTSSHFAGGTEVPVGYEFLPRSGVQSLSVQPLVAGGSMLGLLLVADAQEHEHDPVAAAAIEVVASLAASGLRAARLVRDVADRAREALTGVADAADLRADLTAACIAAIQTGDVTHTCMLLDVEGARAVDDNLGQAARDEVLSKLVEALNGQLRHGDSLYRVEGDEFAVLLATGLPESATAVASRLVRAARDAGAPVALGWALVDGPPAVVQERAAASLREAKQPGPGRADARIADTSR